MRLARESLEQRERERGERLQRVIVKKMSQSKTATSAAAQ
jgi:hypothetical protein